MNSLRQTLIKATLAIALTTTAFATPVTFWFSGTVGSINNPSNALPSDIRIGTAVSGRWTFDSSTAGYIVGIGDQSSGVSNFYCGQVSGFSTLVQIGSHNLTNTATIP